MRSDCRTSGSWRPETAGGFSPTFVGELMSDPVVMNKIDHISFHQYGGDSGGADSYIKGSAYPNKTFWVTEVAEPDAIWNHIGQGPTSLMIWEGFDSVYNHAIRAGRGTTAPNDTQGLLNPPVAYNASNGTYSTRSTSIAMPRSSSSSAPDRPGFLPPSPSAASRATPTTTRPPGDSPSPAETRAARSPST